MTKIEKAVLFATRAHAGQVRKGSEKPYILHPMEVMAIVTKFTDDEDVIAAAVLHDTVEDTSITLERLEKEFGPRVAALVASVTEDKKKNLPAESTWLERKREAILHLETASHETKLLCLADKYSNLRDMYEDIEDFGCEYWQRFNQKDGRKHAWYYRENFRILKEEFADTVEILEFEGMMDFVFDDCRTKPFCPIFPEGYLDEEGGEAE
ncbi:MAG: bifunctional (p)ppGpp synthetase/guanosine-3',5'-bis(diphosphate) 3'-pyrophosphohydrolase [Oscillospiraceae bacterium]|nr:bifunctional (p)ppGpp synthetase/guanosine-3',5'-bis(diphosphate) 3'-pyrophosphohydrolase [Oscillospiraceae bacterium]